MSPPPSKEYTNPAECSFLQRTSSMPSPVPGERGNPVQEGRRPIRPRRADRRADHPCEITPCGYCPSDFLHRRTMRLQVPDPIPQDLPQGNRSQSPSLASMRQTGRDPSVVNPRTSGSPTLTRPSARGTFHPPPAASTPRAKTTHSRPPKLCRMSAQIPPHFVRPLFINSSR